VPNVIVIAGPNGAGKSTIAPTLLRGILDVEHFVNADVIARGLSAFNPEGAAIHAGRVMLERLRELARQRVDFAFETTLAGRGFAPWLARLTQDGYDLRLVYVWIASPELCIARVARRVEAGGHHINDDVVRRRYAASLSNFFHLYRPLAQSWQFYDNSSGTVARLIAESTSDRATVVYDEVIWNIIRREGDLADRHGT
jgi:predicted ABC-type ATPase